MKFLLRYDKPKKKGWSKQEVTMYDLEDCQFWEKVILERGCKNIEIRPL